MPSPICFVIMPYGGTDEKKKKHYLGVFQGIIQPAVQALGMEAKRSDISGQPGDITRDIIEDLAKAAIVVADLSEGNPNVLFELGIRHALRKSGTVHIINKEQHIPFDVRQYRAVEYSTDIAELTHSVTELRAAIEKRLQQPGRSDNPVHDTLTELPIDVLHQDSVDYGEKFRSLQLRIEELASENDQLKDQVAALKENPHSDEDATVDALFDAADNILESTGQNILLHLNKAATEGGQQAFVRELRAAMKSPHLSDNDLAAIANLCVELNLQAHRLAVLREATRRYPQSSAFFFHLTTALLRSRLAAEMEEGESLVSERFGIIREGASIKVTNVAAISDLDDVLPLFDHYINSDQPGKALALLEGIQSVVGEQPVFYRNKARALAKLKRYEEARNLFKSAIEASPDDGTLFSFYSDFLDDSGNYEEAYIQLEHATKLRPSANNLVNLAVQILNRGWLRGADGSVRHTGRRKELRAAIVPLVTIAALHATIRDRTGDVVSLLAREHLIEEAHFIAQGKTPTGAYDESVASYLFPEGYQAIDLVDL